MKYRSVQFTPDGSNWIFDHEGNTIDEVWNKVENQGSKWVFYPFPFIVTNKPWQNFKYTKVISAPSGLDFLTGKTVNRVISFLKISEPEAL